LRGEAATEFQQVPLTDPRGDIARRSLDELHALTAPASRR
jgi:hypothetical protein